MATRVHGAVVEALTSGGTARLHGVVVEAIVDSTFSARVHGVVVEAIVDAAPDPSATTVARAYLIGL
jgi:hypothetical protein